MRGGVIARSYHTVASHYPAFNTRITRGMEIISTSADKKYLHTNAATGEFSFAVCCRQRVAFVGTEVLTLLLAESMFNIYRGCYSRFPQRDTD